MVLSPTRFFLFSFLVIGTRSWDVRIDTGNSDKPFFDIVATSDSRNFLKHLTPTAFNLGDRNAPELQIQFKPQSENDIATMDDDEPLKLIPVDRARYYTGAYASIATKQRKGDRTFRRVYRFYEWSIASEPEFTPWEIRKKLPSRVDDQDFEDYTIFEITDPADPHNLLQYAEQCINDYLRLPKTVREQWLDAARKRRKEQRRNPDTDKPLARPRSTTPERDTYFSANRWRLERAYGKNSNMCVKDFEVVRIPDKKKFVLLVFGPADDIWIAVSKVPPQRRDNEPIAHDTLAAYISFYRPAGRSEEKPAYPHYAVDPALSSEFDSQLIGFKLHMNEFDVRGFTLNENREDNPFYHEGRLWSWKIVFHTIGKPHGAWTVKESDEAPQKAEPSTVTDKLKKVFKSKKEPETDHGGAAEPEETQPHECARSTFSNDYFFTGIDQANIKATF